jgi:hypothetical protein
MEKKKIVLTSLSVFAGLVLGSLVIFGLYTLNQDHKQLGQVVAFLNNQIALSRQSSQLQK